ncbi:MAG: ATP-binding protein [Thermoplasmatota archaeon]
MKFVNRSDEMKMIRDAVSSDHCFVVVTGRRRIGKTRLIREALKDSSTLDLFIPRKRESLALDQLSSLIREQTGYSPHFRNMREMFEYILRLDDRVIFIDEISNLHFVDSGSFSDLQDLMDRAKEERRIRMVVDGSYVGVMNRIFQDRKEPLFGRATNILELQPLGIDPSMKMLMSKGMSFMDSLEAYSLFGGIPRYLEILRDFDDIDSITDSVFAPGSIFLTEGKNLLIEEFGASWDTYFSIMEVISAGKFGPTVISDRLGMEVGMLPKYLQTLKELQLVARKQPLFGKQKHVRYTISDPFLQFWFRLCYPRLELYKDGRAGLRKEEARSEIGRGMEKAAVDLIFSSGSLPFEPDEIGSWWDRSGNEIDILFYSKKERKISAGEIKWRQRPVGVDTVKRLIDNMEMIDWYNGKRIEYPFILSKNGFTVKARQIMDDEGISGFDVEDCETAVLKGRKLEWAHKY